MSIVVYLGNKQVQIIEGACKGKSVSVKRYYTLDAPEGSIINGIIMDAESFTAFLEDTWKAFKLPTKDVKLVVGSSKFIGKKIAIPKLNEKKTLDFLAREYAGAGREEDLIYSYIPISKGENGMLNVYAEGIAPELIRDYIEIFSKIGVKLSAIHSDEGNLITFCKNTAAKDKQSFVFIIADAMTFTTILWIEGAFYYYNSTRCFHDPGTEEYAEDIARILNQLNQFMKANQVEVELESIEIAGVDPDDKVLYSRAIGELGLGAQVNIFNFTTGGGAVVDPKVQSYLHPVAGLYSNGKSQDLLPQASVIKKDDAEIAQRNEIIKMLIPSMVALVLALIVVISLAVVKHGKTKKLETLEAYNNDPIVMMDVAQYDNYATRNGYLSAQYRAISKVESDIETYPCGNTTVLDVFRNCAIGLAQVECGSFDAASGKVSIVAKSDNVENINKFIKNLTERDEFCGVDYTGYHYSDDTDMWDINVTCTLSEAAGR